MSKESIVPEIIQDQESNKSSKVLRGLGVIALSIATAATTWAIAANHFSQKYAEHADYKPVYYSELPGADTIRIESGAVLRSEPLIPSEVVTLDYPTNPGDTIDQASNVIAEVQHGFDVKSMAYVHKDPSGNMWFGIPKSQLERNDIMPRPNDNDVEWVRKDDPETGADYDYDDIIWVSASDAMVSGLENSSEVIIKSPEDEELTSNIKRLPKSPAKSKGTNRFNFSPPPAPDF